MKKTLLAGLAVGTLLLGTAISASALTLTLNDPNAALSGFSGPYAMVEITDFSSPSSIATVKFDAENSYLLVDGKIADLNVNATAFTAGNFSYGGGSNNFDLKAIDYFASNVVSDFGHFNLQISSQSASNRIDWLQFDLTRTDGGFWGSASEVLTVNDDEHLAAAHIMATGVTGAVITGYVADTPVPEPATMFLLGTGLTGLAALRRKKNG